MGRCDREHMATAGLDVTHIRKLTGFCLFILPFAASIHAFLHGQSDARKAVLSIVQNIRLADYEGDRAMPLLRQLLNTKREERKWKK